MQTGELESPKRQSRKRLGRGPGSGHGKTSGKGHKGQRARSGFKSHAWFEGGQMPLQRRVPKRGFYSRNKIYYQLVNVSSLEKKFDDGASVNAEDLVQSGLVHTVKRPVKILGDGELTIKLTVEADKFTKSAEEKITKAGGQVTMKAASQAAAVIGE